MINRLFTLLFLLAAASTAPSNLANETQVRFATINAAMGLTELGELSRRLESGADPQLKALAEVLQRVRPDVLLINEFDFRKGVEAARLFNENYLGKAAPGLESLQYPYHYQAQVNTGVDSGLDIDGNGTLGDPGDAWGFGRFPGQYGMLVLSRFPIDMAAARTFRHFAWHDMPEASKPLNPDGSPYYDEATWNRLRLSSKSHWDLPVEIDGTTVHLLASHPTPPAFDGPEDRNGNRNHDEIRLWADYIDPKRSDYLVDDNGQAGGLAEEARFIIAGDLNADPFDGGSKGNAIGQLLNHPSIDSTCQPRSEGAVEAAHQQGQANASHRGDPALDTADFSDGRVGNLRVDYVLPSAGLDIIACGVFWPVAGAPGHQAAAFSDHRLVWVDVRIGTVQAPND